MFCCFCVEEKADLSSSLLDKINLKRAGFSWSNQSGKWGVFPLLTGGLTPNSLELHFSGSVSKLFYISNPVDLSFTERSEEPFGIPTEEELCDFQRYLVYDWRYIKTNTVFRIIFYKRFYDPKTGVVSQEISDREPNTQKPFLLCGVLLVLSGHNFIPDIVCDYIPKIMKEKDRERFYREMGEWAVKICREFDVEKPKVGVGYKVCGSMRSW